MKHKQYKIIIGGCIDATVPYVNLLIDKIGIENIVIESDTNRLNELTGFGNWFSIKCVQVEE